MTPHFPAKKLTACCIINRVKREQHHKARQQQEQGDPEAPQLDELVPDKLARADDPLEQAIKFLQPLRTLASDRIETHLMAFEIYFRKERPLLMLQSIKRALALQHSHHHLHSCLLRFRRWLDAASLHESVEAVVRANTHQLFKDRSAIEMAEQYLDGPAKESQAAALWGARELRRLAPERTGDMLRHATAVSYPDLSIQGCVEVLDSLREGDFGACEKETELYVEACRAKFPYALAFQPPAPPAPAPAPADAPLQPTENIN